MYTSSGGCMVQQQGEQQHKKQGHYFCTQSEAFEIRDLFTCCAQKCEVMDLVTLLCMIRGVRGLGTWLPAVSNQSQARIQT